MARARAVIITGKGQGVVHVSCPHVPSTECGLFALAAQARRSAGGRADTGALGMTRLVARHWNGACLSAVPLRACPCAGL